VQILRSRSRGGWRKRRKAKRRGLSGAGPPEARDIGNVKIMPWHKPLSNEELIARSVAPVVSGFSGNPSRRRRVLEHVLEIVHGIRRHLQTLANPRVAGARAFQASGPRLHGVPPSVRRTRRGSRRRPYASCFPPPRRLLRSCSSSTPRPATDQFSAESARPKERDEIAVAQPFRACEEIRH